MVPLFVSQNAFSYLLANRKYATSFVLSFPTTSLNHCGILETYQILQYPRILLEAYETTCNTISATQQNSQLCVFNNAQKTIPWSRMGGGRVSPSSSIAILHLSNLSRGELTQEKLE